MSGDKYTSTIVRSQTIATLNVSRARRSMPSTSGERLVDNPKRWGKIARTEAGAKTWNIIYGVK